MAKLRPTARQDEAEGGEGGHAALGFDLLSRFSARPQTKCNRAAISAPAYSKTMDELQSQCQWQLLRDLPAVELRLVVLDGRVSNE